MDLDAVCEAIAAAVTAANIDLNGVRVTATAFSPDALTAPHFFCAEYTLNYDKSFGALAELVLTCRLLVARGDDRSAQKVLRAAASTGVRTISQVFREARGAPGQSSLDGAAEDLHLQRAQGPRLYEVNGTQYYGLEFTAFVMG